MHQPSQHNKLCCCRGQDSTRQRGTQFPSTFGTPHVVDICVSPPDCYSAAARSVREQPAASAHDTGRCCASAKKVAQICSDRVSPSLACRQLHPTMKRLRRAAPSSGSRSSGESNTNTKWVMLACCYLVIVDSSRAATTPGESGAAEAAAAASAAVRAAGAAFVVHSAARSSFVRRRCNNGFGSSSVSFASGAISAVRFEAQGGGCGGGSALSRRKLVSRGEPTRLVFNRKVRLVRRSSLSVSALCRCCRCCVWWCFLGCGWCNTSSRMLKVHSIGFE